MKNKTILLISPEAWGQNHVSKHLYAKYLAQENKVFFINPVSSSKKNPLGTIDCKMETIEPNLIVVDYKNLLPKLNNLPKSVQARIYKKQATQLQKILEIKCFDIVWSFDPYRLWNLQWFKANHHIYHSVDFHPGAKHENELCKSASTTIAVTRLVKEDIIKYHDNIIKIGHGADIDGFENSKNIEIPGNNKIRACYVGNFHRDIDYDVLLSLVQENSNVDFILIGPTFDSNLSQGNQISSDVKNKLEAAANLYFIGSVPANELMSYLFQCHINLVLFKKEREIIHCSPHKLMAYFYSGNITLSNYIDEHRDTSSDIIQMIEDQKQIPAFFKNTIENLDTLNSKSLIEKRRQFALDNSYKNKIDEIHKLL